MQIHTEDGKIVEIDDNESKRIYNELARRMPGAGHHFNIGGRTMMLTTAEMKEVSDYYWEHFGKKAMQDFYEKYQHKAAENIRKALRMAEAPADEHDVKWALAMAFRHGNADLIGEVLFESMEWETAYSALKNIGDADND